MLSQFHERCVLNGQQGAEGSAPEDAAAARAISPGEAMGAMRDMLAAAGVALSEDTANMVQESLKLREQLTSAQAQTEACSQSKPELCLPAPSLIAAFCWCAGLQSVDCGAHKRASCHDVSMLG